MNRQDIYDATSVVCDSYWIGQHEGECITKYVVLKFNSQSPSIENKKGGWQYLEVMAYVPDTSISLLDPLTNNLLTALLQLGLEPTGNMTPDYLDTDKKAFMRSIEFRMPKEIN